jgi:hypothetical protein
VSKSGRALEWLTGWATSALRDFWRILTAALIALIIVYALRLWAIGSMGGALPMESLSMGYYNEADT